MAMKLETTNVLVILREVLNDMGYWEFEGKEAEKQLCYIAGATYMANAVMKAISDLGGK